MTTVPSFSAAETSSNNTNNMTTEQSSSNESKSSNSNETDEREETPKAVNVDNDTAAVEDKKSLQQPKRFNFYTLEVAEEIRRETSKDEGEKPSNRFNFYNAAEVGPIQHKRTSSAQPATSAASSTPPALATPIKRSPSLPRPIIPTTTTTQEQLDSNEILRSLQETERQHASQRRSTRSKSLTKNTARHHQHLLPKRTSTKGKSSNPYKDAIQEALKMLQQQQSTSDLVNVSGGTTADDNNDDVVERMRIQDSSPETRKKERLYRKERIEKYASRFEQQVNSSFESSNKPAPKSPKAAEQAPLSTTTTTPWTPPTPGEQSNEGAEELIRRRSESDDFQANNTPKSFDTQPQNNQSLDVSLQDASSVHSLEVQKSVEKVLLAILERADSKSRATTQQQVDTQEELNALSMAMDNLLQPSLSFETVSTVRSRRPNRRESEQQAILASEALLLGASSSSSSPEHSSSVVEELLQDARNGGILLQEDEKKQEQSASSDDDNDDNADEDYITPVSSTELRVDESQQSIEVVESSDVFEDEQERSDSDDEEDDDEEEESAIASSSATASTDEEYDEDDPKNISVDESALTHLLGKLRRGNADRQHEEEEDDDDDDEEYDASVISVDENTLANVLGPLNRKAGGTTGVVLEATSYEEGPPPPPAHEDEGSVPLSPASLYETLSSAVKDAESFMSYISGGYPSVKDKYSTGDDEEAVAVQPPPLAENDDNYDADAHELMRSLCAHLLPYGVDKSADSSRHDRIPVWDESNPDEAGYRIIRLSKRQLRAVELEFEKMVKSVKTTSERDLKGSLSKTEATEDWNGVPDDDFARDLEEAEHLLDEEEKRREEEEDRAKARTDEQESDEDEDNSLSSGESESGSTSDESDTMEGTRSPLLSDDDTLLTAHPDFPGVKTTGKGEIGDLEYFHLPIIYKSNVTGFEPTKDLYLEPGNVVAGTYLVENELGSAAFSTAYRCIDLSSEMRTTEKGEEVQEEVCLKVIKNTKDFFDQSLDEIKILELLRQTGKCQENNILEMKTFFYHREHLIIVTELLRQNLFEFGKFITDSDEERYFTRTRLCYITRQVLVALDFVHKMGLVHSDVKPENILLSSYSRAKVKLIDFGSSCYLTDRQSSYIQSRSYRAPEVILGLPYDGKIDIWSLGCVVAEMYTGEVTFQNDSIVSMLSRIEAICGSFPRHMIAAGRQSGRYFTKSGLLYEQVDSENRDKSALEGSRDNSLLDVFQPKRTSLAARLGHPDIETEDEAHFVDFCSKLLAVDPDSRPTAAEALKHPWIVAGESITEEDIKYPSK